MIRVILSAIAILLIFSDATLADLPSEPHDFQIISRNNRFLAVCREIPDSDWTVTVFEIVPDEAKLVEKWSTGTVGWDYAFVTEDGQYLVFVEFFYFADAYMVMIVDSSGTVTGIKGAEFDVSEHALTPTVSHLLWLDEDVYPPIELYHRHYDSSNVLFVHNIDGREHEIDVGSGKIIRTIDRAGWEDTTWIIGILSILVLAAGWLGFLAGTFTSRRRTSSNKVSESPTSH